MDSLSDLVTTPQVTLPLVTFLIRGHGDRALLQQAMHHISRCGLPAQAYEVFLINAGAAKRTSGAEDFGIIQAMLEPDALNSVQDNITIGPLAKCRGQYLVVINEDCHPRPGSIQRMIGCFQADPQLGAAVFTLCDDSGVPEDSDFPNVAGGSSTSFRRETLQSLGVDSYSLLGGVDEFEATCLLMAAGWTVRSFADLRMSRHGPPPAIADVFAAQVHQHLAVAARYFPRAWVLPYAREWMKRARLLASAQSQKPAYYRGLARGVAASLRRARRTPLQNDVFENLVRLQETERRLRRAQDRFRIQRILLLDLSPNLLAFRLAAKSCDIRIVAIADPTIAADGRQHTHRGVPIVSDEAAMRLRFDAAVACSLWPAQAAARCEAWRHFDSRPIIDLFEDEALTLLTWHRSVAKLRLNDAALSAAPVASELTCVPPHRVLSEVHQTAARNA